MGRVNRARLLQSSAWTPMWGLSRWALSLKKAYSGKKEGSGQDTPDQAA